MSWQGLNPAWYDDPFTGLFAESGPVPLRPYDPAVPVWSGSLRLPDGQVLTSGGAGWDAASAEAAGVGEAIERCLPWPLSVDQVVEATVATWPLDEPPVEPERWVLFHPEQYVMPGFPFQPLTRATRCRWVCFRQAGDGRPWWVPEEFAFLATRPGTCNRFAPGFSTGLSCGRGSDPVLLRGLQEVIERDALVGAWWECYPMEEYEAERVWALLPRVVRAQVERPNLRYRFYRIATPWSAHVTIVTLTGEDREGLCFATGSACRETRAMSWLKSVLEAVQGRHYVRRLLGELAAPRLAVQLPESFANHAVFYSAYPERLATTPFSRAVSGNDFHQASEGFAELTDRLGPDHLVLFRNMTPPGLAVERLGWYVLRVLVPGLQPLHGHHALPFLGGPLWAPRQLRDWADVPPHPFA
jgi:ribosomal protein S12 methylthiotransferase accessory factor